MQPENMEGQNEGHKADDGAENAVSAAQTVQDAPQEEEGVLEELLALRKLKSKGPKKGKTSKPAPPLPERMNPQTSRNSDDLIITETQSGNMEGQNEDLKEDKETECEFSASSVTKTEEYTLRDVDDLAEELLYLRKKKSKWAKKGYGLKPAAPLPAWADPQTSHQTSYEIPTTSKTLLKSLGEILAEMETEYDLRNNNLEVNEMQPGNMEGQNEGLKSDARADNAASVVQTVQDAPQEEEEVSEELLALRKLKGKGPKKGKRSKPAHSLGKPAEPVIDPMTTPQQAFQEQPTIEEALASVHIDKETKLDAMELDTMEEAFAFFK